MKIVFAALVAGAAAFNPQLSGRVSTAIYNGPHIGSGGMADTRNPDAMVHEDPRKSISAAPSFEEYLKMRDGGGGAAPAPAPAAAAPAPAWTPPAPAPAAAAPAPAWTPPAPAPASGEPHIGSGGMADTRNPDAMVHEDPRKSISAAPSFEEYLKQRQG
jgi:hypothetical protein